MKCFYGKVVVIIGVGLGIGWVIVMLLVKKGCYLVLLDIDENSLKDIVIDLCDYLVRVIIYVVNVSWRNEVYWYVD